MKCPNDQTEMVETVLTAGSGSPHGGMADVKLQLTRQIFKLTNKSVVDPLQAWYCSKCGKVEIYSKPYLEIEGRN